MTKCSLLIICCCIVVVLSFKHGRRCKNSNSNENTCETFSSEDNYERRQAVTEFSRLTTRARKNPANDTMPDTRINFILYNNGIKYKQKDSSVNLGLDVKFKSNCIVVVSRNICYGFNTAKKKKSGKEKEVEEQPEEKPQYPKAYDALRKSRVGH